MEGTKIIFRTEPGSVTIPVGNSVKLIGKLDVSQYPGIRLGVGSRSSSDTAVTIKLILVDGRELLFPLDTIVLEPGDSFTTVYDIPGTVLSITATAAPMPGAKESYIDLVVYGYNPCNKKSPPYCEN